MLRLATFTETETGGGNREPVFTGCRVSVLQDEKFWSWMVVKVTQNVDVLYADEMCP